MYFFLFSLYMAPYALAPYITGFLPGVLQAFLFITAKSYYTIVSYNLMGYVMLQYHETIGFHTVDYEDFRDQGAVMEDFREPSPPPAPPDPAKGLLERVNLLVREGRAEDALTLIKQETRGKIKDLNLSERYYNLLKITGQTADAAAYAMTHLGLLIAAQKKSKACSLYAEHVSRDPQFTPGPEGLLKLAAWMSQSGNAKGAFKASKSFIKAYPDHALTPKAYLFAARLLHEKLGQTDQARKVLHALIKKHPNHDVSRQARKYAKQMAANPAGN